MERVDRFWQVATGDGRLRRVQQPCVFLCSGSGVAAGWPHAAERVARCVPPSSVSVLGHVEEEDQIGVWTVE